jgi:hypothetical protein
MMKSAIEWQENSGPNIESIRFLIELVVVDTRKARQPGEKDHSDSTPIDEIRQSGFVDQLHKE